MNTADLLLLNSYNNLNVDGDFNKLIKISIKICKSVIESKAKMSPSGATKNSTVFEEVQRKSTEYVDE